MTRREPFLRVVQDREGASVWMEPVEGDVCLGICLGAGATLQEAILDATSALESITHQLGEFCREKALYRK